MAGRHGNKGVVARILPVEDMPYLADGTPVDIVLNPIGVPSRMNVGQVLETHLGWAANALGFRAVTPVFDGATRQAHRGRARHAHGSRSRQARWRARSRRTAARAHDGADRAGYERLDLAKLEAWLTQQGYDARDDARRDAAIGDAKPGLPRATGSETSCGQKRVRGTDAGTDREDGRTSAIEAGYAPPTWGKQVLLDGRTGDAFDQPVTVGYIYMLKLVHLVEDKIHARSTGPYSLITQQPLGGKAQFGGQRFGEMEVWALEAYGAAHILQELLTVKSDDIVGRVKAYEAIVKGEDVMEPGVPESFKVLVKELQSLGLSVEVLNEDEESVEFVEEGERRAGAGHQPLGVRRRGTAECLR